jgi:hypothetical protein
VRIKRNIYTLKLLIFLLCFCVILLGINHVFCMEFSDVGITRVHLQLHDCNFLHKAEAEVNLSHQSHKPAKAQTSKLMEVASHYSDCIDEHIQFRNQTTVVDVSSIDLIANPLPAFLNPSSQNFLSNNINSLYLFQHIHLSLYKLSSIRTTVLQI